MWKDGRKGKGKEGRKEFFAFVLDILKAEEERKRREN